MEVPSDINLDGIETMSLDLSDAASFEISQIEPISELFSVASDTKKDTRISRALLTLFPPTENDLYLRPETYFKTSIFVNWCAKFEMCPDTNKLHVHAYVEFDTNKRPRFNALRQMLIAVIGINSNIRVPKRCNKNQRLCAVNYVLKPDTSTESPPFIYPKNTFNMKFDVTLWEKRSKKTTKSKSDTTEEQLNYIESKPKSWTWNQILHESADSKLMLCTCSWGKKYHEGRFESNQRRVIKDVIIMYGAGGTGKTTTAMAWGATDEEPVEERYYRRNTEDGNFWGGGRTAYRGQRIVHFEEFAGSEAFHKLKEVMDIGKPGPSVNIKGSGTELNHEAVILTSNIHPAGWYRKYWENDPKQFHPFWRRITQVRYYPALNAEGELNVPTETVAPYYIDQTEEWKSFAGDFDKCKDHAESHWPLRELEAMGIGPQVERWNR